MGININIHANPNIEWQKKLSAIVKKGLSKHNIKARITSHVAPNTADVAIILGPNFWKPIEDSGKPYIMMNRKFLGFRKEIVHENVAISWDGFNGRGTFCVDEVDPKRLLKYVNEEDITDSVFPKGKYYLLCHQADVGRCKKFPNVQAFYSQAVKGIPAHLLKIRRKLNPEYTSVEEHRQGFLKDIKEAHTALVLNSTVSVDLTLAGVPVTSFDEGDPVYAVSSRSIDDLRVPHTRTFMEYLAHCQWHYDEIESGEFWERIFPKRGPRLCEWKDM